MIDHLHHIKHFGYEIRGALEAGDLRRFAAIMNEHWERKNERHPPDFPNYEAGSWGPAEADHLIERDGRRWRRL